MPTGEGEIRGAWVAPGVTSAHQYRAPLSPLSIESQGPDARGKGKVSDKNGNGEAGPHIPILEGEGRGRGLLIY